MDVWVYVEEKEGKCRAERVIGIGAS